MSRWQRSSGGFEFSSLWFHPLQGRRTVRYLICNIQKTAKNLHHNLILVFGCCFCRSWSSSWPCAVSQVCVGSCARWFSNRQEPNSEQWAEGRGADWTGVARQSLGLLWCSGWARLWRALNPALSKPCTCWMSCWRYGSPAETQSTFFSLKQMLLI